MTTRRAAVATLVLVLACGAAFGQVMPAEYQRATLGTYAIEGGAATAGGILIGFGAAFVAGMVANMHGLDTGPALTYGIMVGSPLAAVGLAGGASIAGNALGQQGKFWPTLAWSAGSVAAALGLAAAGVTISNTDDNVGPVWYAGMGVVGVGVLAPIVLPVLGYNLSRPHAGSAQSSRFLLPAVGLYTETRLDHTKVTSTRVELLRFAF